MLPISLKIEPLAEVEVLKELAAEAETDGHRMVSRLIEEWRAGINRFEKDGEALFVARMDGRVVGVCGLNVDPFAAEDGVGRVRRLYVSKIMRRRGIGAALMRRIMEEARWRFRELHLRTFNPEACTFYEALGFERVGRDERCTHRMVVA